MTEASGRWPELRALLLAALLSLCFLGPAVRPDRVLLPFTATCMAPWFQQATPAEREAARAQATPHLGDKWMQCLPFTAIVQERWREGSPPVWTRRLFGGQMLAGDVVPQPFHPLQLLLLLGEPLGLLGLLFFLLQVLTGWWQFRFLRVLGLPELACHLGLVTWCCGLWVQARVHHPMVLTAACTAPLVLEMVERARLGGSRAPLPILALAIGWAWLGGFTQAAVQVTLLAAAYALCTVRAPRTLLWLGFAIGCGALLGAVQTLPAFAAAKLSSRGFEPASVQREFALQAEHLLNAVVPNLLEPVREFTFDSIYQSRESLPQLLILDNFGVRFNHAETAFGVGIAGLLLAAAAVFRRTVPHGWFFSGLLVMTLALSLGLPLVEVVRLIPGAGVGDVKRWLYLASFALSVLAALGAARVLAGTRRTPLVIAAGSFATLGLLLTWWVWHAGTEGVMHWFAEQLARRYDAIQGTLKVPIQPEHILGLLAPGQADWQHAVLRHTGVLLALAGTASAIALCLRPRAGVLILVATSAAELLAQGHGRCVAVPRAELLPPAPILDPVRAEGPDGFRFQRLGGRPKGSFQASSLLPPSVPVLLGIADAGGYSVFTTRRLDEFWNAAEPGIASGGAVTSFVDDATLRHPLLDRFGVRWILSDHAVEQPGVVDATPPSAQGMGLWLYRRETALPRAVLVHKVRALIDETMRLPFLARRDLDVHAEAVPKVLTANVTSGNYDPAREVVVETPGLESQVGAPDPGDTVVVQPGPDGPETAVQVTTRHGGILVLAEPWHPGLRAELDGQDTPVHIADHALRAVRVPPGSHRVRLVLASGSFRLGALLSVLALLGTLALGMLPLRRDP